MTSSRQPRTSMQAGVYGQPYSTYGAAGGDDKPLSARGKSGKPSLAVYLAAAYFVPCLIFAIVFCSTCSSMNYNDSSSVQAISIVMLVFALLLFLPAFNAVRTRGESGDPKWYAFLFATSVLAWILATTLGTANYKVNLVPYMDVQRLNTYPSVNPATDSGQAMMDGGRFTFVKGAKPDLAKSIGFRSLDIYCAAPVTMGNQNMSTYDFWAVGKNCCSGHGPDFSCGEVSNPNAHSGLRLMREEQRAYFRLAVQQAQASYNIHANHPIFFYWMQDPSTEINAYQEDAHSYLLLGLFGFFGAQLILVVLAVIVYSQLNPF